MKDLNLEENSGLNNKFLSRRMKVRETSEKESNEISQIPTEANFFDA